MHLYTRNVNTAFRQIVRLFKDNPNVSMMRVHYNDDGEIVRKEEYSERIITKKPSRNGNVLMINEPVTITYWRPRERILFNAARDANPFFHLYEALWMLAGRNDVEPLAYYAKQVREYSDDSKTFNGAYGYRWRRAKVPETAAGVVYRNGGPDDIDDIDQLDILVAHLKADPNSRRAVLQMWNVEDDLLKIGLPCNQCGGTGLEELIGETGRGGSAEFGDCSHCNKGMKQQSRDTCCNLSVMFSIRETEHNVRYGTDQGKPMKVSNTTSFLDMTVTNRSNDLIWGCLGANYVHFTFLQEYMAARLGVEVGKYHHFTNNLHVYDDPTNPKVAPWKPEEWLKDCVDYYNDDSLPEPVQTRMIPLIKDPSVFEQELAEFVELHSTDPMQKEGGCLKAIRLTEPFLRDVATPALCAFHSHKSKRGSVELWLEQIKTDDWRIACTNWLQRRIK